MSRAQRVYEEGARDISRVMRQQLTEGTQAAGRGFDELETKARKAYLSMQDAGEKVAAAERKLEAARERGSANIEGMARRVERARLSEIEAIERATRAYQEYEQAAQQAGEEGGRSFLGGIRGSLGQAAGLGEEFAGGLASGFAGAGALSRLAGFAVPGVGWVAAGVSAGALLAQGVSQGLESLQMKDVFQARLGLDEATMARYGQAAGSAYADMWGASVEDNLRAAQFAVQGGVINASASDEEIQQTIAHMQTLATVMGVDVQEAARATGQLIRGGFATDGQQAADIIASGFQDGLDIAGDWLDTITEYTTQFRKLGLDGGDAIGLIRQGLEGGARDSDKVADSLKEFSIRAVDGSKLTAEGFAALGLSADDMAARFLKGGDSARQAFDVTLRAVQSLSDPVEQALVWQSLFGTQWEDMGDAINNMDLSKARTEFGSTEGAIDSMTTQLSEHTDQWDVLSRNIDQTFTRFKEWLADTDIARFLNGTLPGFLNLPFQQPPPPVDDTGLPITSTVPRNANPFTPDASDPTNLLIPGYTPSAPAPSAPTGGREPGWGGRPPGGPARSPLEDIFGLKPPGTPGAPGAPGVPPPPAPGNRTPMLTETQKEALEESGGGGGRESLPPAPVLPIQYTNTAGMPDQIASATTRLDEIKHTLAEKEARLNQLEQSNVATDEDIQKAENDVAKARQDELEATRKLQDAQVKAYEGQSARLSKTSSDLTSFFASIDQDFGVSEGLPGIAENITKFLMNLAIAPAMGALGAVQAANGFAPGQAGSGLFGMAASSGMFGRQFMPQTGGYRGASYGYVPGGYGTSADAMIALAQGANGGSYSYGASDLANGLADCSGAISDLYEVLTTGMANSGRAFTTESDFQALGFQRGFMPGALNIGVHNGGGGRSSHMAATLPNGVNFEAGGAHGGIAYGGPAAGARDPQFENQYYFPLGGVPQASRTPAAPAAGSGTGATPGGWIGPQGLPSGLWGGGGESPVLGATPTRGLGTGLGAFTASGRAAPPSSVSGGRPYGASLPPSGGISFNGGILGAALSTAAGAAGGAGSFGAGGGAASAAADLGMQLLGRAAGAVGQYAGNLVGAGLETFALNGSALGDPSSSWIGRILGGIAGARPALPNTAGALGGEENPNMAEGGKPKQANGPLTPEQAALQQKALASAGKAGASGTTNNTTNNINVTNNRAREDGTGQMIQAHLNAGQASVQPR
ncbi:hypothetical protein BST38_25495 [Mycolicibacterium parafortuitum]|nr:hypothetical protein BST38_25495 [Mycolicibacterium parafortuitum]